MIAASWTDGLLPLAVSNTLVASGLAVLALLAARVIKSPTIAHCLWVLVLLKLVTPPLFEVAIPLPDLAPAAIEAAPHADPLGAVFVDEARDELPLRPTSAAVPAADVDWARLALFTWLAGAVLALGVGVSRAARFHRGLRHARPASADVRTETEHLSRLFGLRRTPQVRVVPGRLSPMLWGFFGRAQILLPEILQRTLTPEQKRTLLAHELAHLQRRDHWIRILEMSVRAVYWWNPLAFWACRELRNVEEECCDAWVVWALPEASRSYADALLNTAEFLSDAPDSTPVPASGIGKVTNLKRRLTMIMQGDNRRSLNHLGRIAVFGLAAVTLPMVPAFAQDVHRHPSAKATHGGIDKNAVTTALKRAIHLLRENRHGHDAEVLMALLKKVDSGSVKHTHDAKGREDSMHAIEKEMKVLTDRLHDAEQEGRREQAAELRTHLRRLREHAAHLHEAHRKHAEERSHAEARARDLEAEHDRLVREKARRHLERDRDRDRGDGSDRMRHLEERVEHLTRVVERIVHARERALHDREVNRRKDRRDETEEIIEEEEVEEEETEEVKEVKKKDKKAKARDRDRKRILENALRRRGSGR